MEHRKWKEDLRQALGAFDTWITEENGDTQLRLEKHHKRTLIKAITRRDETLRGYAHQAIRLAVALQAIAPRPCDKAWVDMLHGPLGRLTVHRFRDVFERYPSCHVVPTDKPTIYQLKGPGLDANDGKPFLLHLYRAPVLGGYLDFVCGIFKWDFLNDLIQRAIAEGNAQGQAEVLHAAVTAHLKPLLEPDHLVRQRLVIETFLKAYPQRDGGHDIKTHLDITDDVILSFWEETGPKYKDDSKLDGFTTWQNAARLLVAYRAAVRNGSDDATIDDGYGHSESAVIVAHRPSVREDSDTRSLEDDEHYATEDITGATDDAASQVAVWVSPLAELADSEDKPPAVKWFASQKGRGLVATFLTEKMPQESDDEERPENAFADGKPDAALALTWLRYVAFGPRQGSRRSGGDAATEGFDAIVARLGAVAEDLETADAAAIWALLNLAPAMGLRRLARINVEAATEALAEAQDVDRNRVRKVFEELSELEAADTAIFRKMTAELASAGAADLDAMRAQSRELEKAEVLEPNDAGGIARKLSEVAQKDPDAVRAILIARAVLAAKNAAAGFAASEDLVDEAISILLAEPETSSLIKTCRDAYSKINRAGFRKEDRGSPEVFEALELGTILVPDILAELGRMKAHCEAMDLQVAFQKDVTRFEAVFDQLYAQG